MRLILVLLSMAACSHKHHLSSDHGHKANEHMHKKSHAELIKSFDDPARDEWQQPSKVIELMGALKNKKLIDIGSGSGYFTFKFQKAGARVVAADVDDKFLAHIQSQKGAPEIRKIEYSDPKMNEAEFDFAFNSNTYHHIDNRIDYFKKVLRGLKTGGKLVIVDFKLPMPEGKRIGPKESMRIPVDVVLKELSLAGFGRFEIYNHALPLQYVVVAMRD
jgi:ubiquinone/menaquinone biosynthesis C-methylase UbiE